MQTKVLIVLIIACVLFAGCAQKGGTTTTTQKTPTTYTANYSNPYGVGVERNLPAEAASGTTFTVTLNLTINESKKPGILGVTETYPSNWIVSNISDQGLYRQKRMAIEWLFFAPFRPPVQNTTITYQLTTPKGTSGTYFFEGAIIVGEGQETPVTGQNSITIK